MSDSSRPHELQPARLSVHRILQARVLEWVAIAFICSVIFFCCLFLAFV